MTQKGTYKIAVLNEGVFANWKVGGETKRWRGDASTFAKEVPADAQELRATLSQSRVEIFITSGKPTRDTLKTSGTGLELDPVTHPNDLVAGAPASFRLLLDGKPAPDLKVTVVPGGNRYRDKLGEMSSRPTRTESSASHGRKPACTGWKRSHATTRPKCKA